MQRRIWILGASLWMLANVTRADCQADQGSVTSISADGVTVTCNTSAPNPFTSGIGSQATNTNLTVNIAADSQVDTTAPGVTLASGGSLSNSGSIRSSSDAVLVTDSLGSTSPSIDNDGSVTSTAAAGINIATSFNNSSVDNSGTVQGITLGVGMPGGQLDNSGTISVSGEDGTAVSAGGATVNNTGTITGTATGVTGSGTTDNSGVIEAGTSPVILSNGTLINSGQIRFTSGSGTAVAADNSSLTNSGTVTSDTTAFALNGGSLDNTGTVDGAVDLSGGASLTNSGSINLPVTATGNSSITNSGTISAARSDMTAVTFSGGGNTLTLQSGSSISGEVRASFDGAPTDNLVLEGQGAASTTVLNFGSVVMSGETWSLSGLVTARQLTIESGRLNINGTFDTRVGTTTRALVDLRQGTLGGTGVLFADVNNASGTVAPGDATGNLAINGDYTQGSEGTLRIASDPSGRIGQLGVGGTASLAGTVVVQAGSDGIYDFLTAFDGIEGEFDELVVDGRALVTLVQRGNTLSFVRGSTTVEDNVVFAALDAATLTLDALQPGGRSNGQRGLWLKPIGHYGDKDESEGIAGGDFTIFGGMAGIDWSLGKLRIGAGAGYTNTDLDIDDGGEGETDNVIFGAYMEYASEHFHSSLTLSGGSNEFEHDRSIFVNDQRSKANADYDGDTLALRWALGVNMPMRGPWRELWVFEPELRADYIVIDLDPYIEAGGTGLQIQSEDDIESAEFGGLLHVRRTTMDGLGVAPRAHIGVVHRIAIDDREWTATDTASGVSLLLPGDDEDLTSFRFGAGLDFQLGRHWLGSVDYLGEVGDEGEGHSLVAGIKLLL